MDQANTLGEPGAEAPLDRLVDELLPEELEWRRLAHNYPLATLVIAAAGGFWIGRRHGRALVSAASDFLGREMTSQVGTLFDGLTGNASRDPAEPSGESD